MRALHCTALHALCTALPLHSASCITYPAFSYAYGNANTPAPIAAFAKLNTHPQNPAFPPVNLTKRKRKRQKFRGGGGGMAKDELLLFSWWNPCKQTARIRLNQAAIVDTLLGVPPDCCGGSPPTHTALHTLVESKDMYCRDEEDFGMGGRLAERDACIDTTTSPPTAIASSITHGGVARLRCVWRACKYTKNNVYQNKARASSLPIGSLAYCKEGASFGPLDVAKLVHGSRMSTETGTLSVFFYSGVFFFIFGSFLVFLLPFTMANAAFNRLSKLGLAFAGGAAVLDQVLYDGT